MNAINFRVRGFRASAVSSLGSITDRLSVAVARSEAIRIVIFTIILLSMARKSGQMCVCVCVCVCVYVCVCVRERESVCVCV